MKLFFFNNKLLNPLIIIIAKLDNSESVEKLEAYTHEIFQILIDENEADETNIIVFSIIKDHEKCTINLIQPSTKSKDELVKRCSEDVKLINNIIVNTISNINSKFYFEILDNKILMHMKEVNLNALASYYLVN